MQENPAKAKPPWMHHLPTCRCRPAVRFVAAPKAAGAPYGGACGVVGPAPVPPPGRGGCAGPAQFGLLWRWRVRGRGRFGWWATPPAFVRTRRRRRTTTRTPADDSAADDNAADDDAKAVRDWRRWGFCGNGQRRRAAALRFVPRRQTCGPPAHAAVADVEAAGDDDAEAGAAKEEDKKWRRGRTTTRADANEDGDKSGRGEGKSHGPRRGDVAKGRRPTQSTGAARAHGRRRGRRRRGRSGAFVG